MIRITDILDRVAEYYPQAELDTIDRAYIFSARVHAGQVRLSGEPYLTHPLEVAGILAEMNLDPVSIAAGLLHDVVEDTHSTEEEIEDIFGREVRHIVSGVTKLSKISFSSSQKRQAESIRKMLLAMADDIRVILIKLADRLHNMRTLQFHKKPEKQQKIAQETLDIYAPIASRLGIYWMKKELEDTSFKYLMPDEYSRIEQMVAKDKKEREEYIETVKKYIREKMEENGLSCECEGRYKHFYSIFQKMARQNLDFKDVYDIIAFRLVLNTKSQCYEALGILHDLWKPIDIKFKDYIGRPKPNMYQSLHTTVIGPYGERMEIQIRTHEMDQVAKAGIAAHWSYKEGRKADQNLTRKFAWIQNLIENQENISDPDEFLENVRIDLFPEEVYVFTPRGEIRTLVRGATPVDFAYNIHTEVGHQCTGAKVNGRMVPLKYELQTGDVVEILTTKGHHPSKDWLSFVKTVKARSRIRQWIKTQDKERSLSLGRELCEKEFRKHRLNFNELLKSEEMDAVREHFGFKTVEDMIASVGYGKITPLQLVRKISKQGEESQEPEKLPEATEPEKAPQKPAPRTGVMVKGMDDILIRFAKCCQPVPGDPIIGYITRGHGVTVHQANCVNALKMNPERRIEVEWHQKPDQTYPVKIRIRSLDRVGLLADLTANISKNRANILSVNSQTRENKTVDSVFTLAVRDTQHLNRLMADIRRIKHISEVRRIKT